MVESIVVVGGGLAGLATGVFAQRSGYRVTVVERHTVPGGVCTTWDREGFEFDACIHWLMGGRPGHPFHGIYEETGALDKVRLEPIDHFSTYTDEVTGASLALTKDLDRLVSDVGQLCPADVPLVEELVQLARRLHGFEPSFDTPSMLSWMLEHRSELLAMVMNRQPVSRWAERSHHRLLREGLFGGLPELPGYFLAAMLAGLEEGSMARVLGGSRAFAAGIADRFTALGGELRLGVEVEQILVEDDRAVGARLANGEVLRADRVVSAAPGHTTIFRLLGGRYTTRQIREMYTSWPVFPGILVLSIGADTTWPHAPVTRQLLLSPPPRFAHRDVNAISVRLSSYDPGLAPEGSTAVGVTLEHDFDFWNELHHTPTAYAEAKEEVAQRLIARLEPWLPGIGEHVVTWDLATPYTYWRYTRAWRGAYEGWLPRASMMFGSVDKAIRGLDRFHMVGQWVEPGGGVPTALASARNLVQTLCRKDSRSFAESEARRTPGRSSTPPK